MPDMFFGIGKIKPHILQKGQGEERVENAQLQGQKILLNHNCLSFTAIVSPERARTLLWVTMY